MAVKPTYEELKLRVKALEKKAFEHKRVTEAIKKGAGRFRFVFERSHEGMIIHQVGKIKDVNRRVCELTGYTRQQLLTMSIPELFPKAEQTEIKKQLNRTVHPGPIVFEKKWERADGSVIDVEVSTSVFDLKEGTRLGIIRDIADRKRTEKEILRSHQIQTTLNKLLSLSLENVSLENMLGQCLELITSIPWLALESKGAISLVGNDDTSLVMAAHRNLNKAQLKTCARVPFGRCLCGRAALSGEIVFADRIDERHEIQYDGIPPHGHYCVPIISRGRNVLGVVNVYVREGHRRDQEEEDFLAAIANTLANIIEHKQDEQALQQREKELEQLKNRLQAENVYLQKEIKLNHNFEQIIGRSRVFREVLHRVEQVAPTDTTVLILGETGTGKEMIARAIHSISRRRERTFVKVNCAALPPTLIESELFGHEKGAFTGALSRSMGRFELADGGTIFLDEIGDLPPELQAKLLHILHDSEFQRVGGHKEIKVDVRLIAATNSDLGEAMKNGRFREDLYYRLNVFPINCPPLRQRRGDIPLLARHFAKKYGAKMGKRIDTIPQRVMNTFESYPWPGNVRELENVIERATILAADSVLRIDESLTVCPDIELPSLSRTNLIEVERNHILNVLEASNWIIEGKGGAALRLGLKPATLRSRMKRIGIKRPQPDHWG